MKLSVDSMQTRPFTIIPVNPYTPALNNPDIVNTVKQISALKRGRKKELVEKEIFYRI
jgi:predicted CoA-binding protein